MKERGLSPSLRGVWRVKMGYRLQRPDVQLLNVGPGHLGVGSYLREESLVVGGGAEATKVELRHLQPRNSPT